MKIKKLIQSENLKKLWKDEKYYNKICANRKEYWNSEIGEKTKDKLRNNKQVINRANNVKENSKLWYKYKDQLDMTWNEFQKLVGIKDNKEKIIMKYIENKL